MSRLLHYSATPLGEIRSIPQPSDHSRAFKPRGLWLSVEGDYDWKSWCEGEIFCLENLACAHEVTLHPSAKILRISDADGIDDLTERFPVYFPISGHDAYIYGIQWAEIAKDYQGIIIAPYIWSRRLDMKANWYYSWDCSSGCIWDASAIQSVKLLDARSAIE